MSGASPWKCVGRLSFHFSGRRREQMKTGQVNLDHLTGHFRGHFRGRLRGTFRGSSRGSP